MTGDKQLSDNQSLQDNSQQNHSEVSQVLEIITERDVDKLELQDFKNFIAKKLTLEQELIDDLNKKDLSASKSDIDFVGIERELVDMRLSQLPHQDSVNEDNLPPNSQSSLKENLERDSHQTGKQFHS